MSNPAVKLLVRGVVPMATPVYDGNQSRVGDCCRGSESCI